MVREQAAESEFYHLHSFSLIVAMGSNRSTGRAHHQGISWTTDTYAPYNDGHQWRKYGEKKLSNSNFPRFYYRCTYKNEMKCAATKQVQQKDASDPPLFSVTYFNHHTCSTSSNPMGSTRYTTVQSSSKKLAVPLCFSSHSHNNIEQPTFLTSSATPASLSIQSYRANLQQPDRTSSATPASLSIQYYRANHLQPDRNAYARQFQWTGTAHPTSNGPAKMEIDNFSEASASSSSTGALSRTLLPIGQSRCIEYFHFL